MDEAKLHELLGKMVTELGAAFVGASVIIGDQLGLYKALAAHGAVTARTTCCGDRAGQYHGQCHACT